PYRHRRQVTHRATDRPQRPREEQLADLHGIVVYELRPVEATLEDAFMALTHPPTTHELPPLVSATFEGQTR
ncbi:hypothetical protein, partial [Rhodococcoides fascians]|uniref:hypothetical protein n=1 Tax=Rhodococcoides fascians TaxID=1828 RepID=UPI001E42A786